MLNKRNDYSLLPLFERHLSGTHSQVRRRKDGYFSRVLELTLHVGILHVSTWGDGVCKITPISNWLPDRGAQVLASVFD